MPAPMSFDPEEYMAGEVRRQINRAADQFADIAERIRRHAILAAPETVGKPGRKTYASIVSDVLREIRNGQGNLDLGQLVTAASDADIARATKPVED